ncbi:hypothetical protein PUN28_000475 [Cardiocondyla obscurior]|uniref:Ribosomal protein L15 n=1 Tax=Cardiocondyla obscurior TaxID=286306 RepID=A0AAW2GZP3_9HYME
MSNNCVKVFFHVRPYEDKSLYYILRKCTLIEPSFNMRAPRFRYNFVKTSQIVGRRGNLSRRRPGKSRPPGAESLDSRQVFPGKMWKLGYRHIKFDRL